MFNTLLQWQLPLSALFVGLLLARPWLLKRLGPRTVYASWALVPLLLVVLCLPQLSFTVDAVTPIKSYQVFARGMTELIQSGLWWSLLWWSGVALFALMLLKQQSQLRHLKRTARIMPDQAGLPCRQSPELCGPMLTGWFKPMLWLPQSFDRQFSPLQQQQVVQHELVHWLRRDPWCNGLAYVLLSLCWFNPLCWLAYLAYRQDQ